SQIEMIVLSACERIQNVTSFDEQDRHRLYNMSITARTNKIPYNSCPYVRTTNIIHEDTNTDTDTKTTKMGVVGTTILVTAVLSILSLIILIVVKVKNNRQRNCNDRLNVMELEAIRTYEHGDESGSNQNLEAESSLMM
ncbi:hypothetical protein, partial [Candidatus Ichthyocystis hellenicum]